MPSGQQANARAADHLLWLKASRLVEASDVFDPTDPGCGFEFTREHMHCTHGVFGVESNQVTLAEWMNIDKVERSNLYMRANLYNHQDLIQQASEALSAVRKETRTVGGVEFIAPDKLAKFTKGLVDAFKKSDSACARMAKLSKFHGSIEGLALARVGEWTRGVTSKGGKFDKGIVAGSDRSNINESGAWHILVSPTLISEWQTEARLISGHLCFREPASQAAGRQRLKRWSHDDHVRCFWLRGG